MLDFPHGLVVFIALAHVGAVVGCDGTEETRRDRIARTPAAGVATPLDAADSATGETGADAGSEIEDGNNSDNDDDIEIEIEIEIDIEIDIEIEHEIEDQAGPDTAVPFDIGDAGPDVPEVAPSPTGTPADPIPVDRFPFVVDDDTTAAPSSALDRYTCAPTTDESGPEHVYRFDLAAAGALVAEVAEADGVDVDLHLLAADPALAPPASVPCLARDNLRLEADLAPGRYWLVVDTYVAASGPKPGAYRVALEHTVLDAWQTTVIAPGIVWKKKVYADYAGGRQTINTLDVDLREPSVSIRPHGGDGCIRPSRVAPAEGAIAAVNAGFFDTGPGTCPPLDLVKIEGDLVSTNRLTGAAQRSVGVGPDGRPLIAWIAAGEDWPAAWSAIGSYPSLVTDGAILLEPDKDSDFFDGRHPRTALGLTDDDHLLLVTVEGRTAAGRGMTLRQLAQHLVSLGAVHAVNLDGGGSTAMWIADQSINGVVSFPSDDGTADHLGERAVSDVLLVFSTP